MRSTVRGLGHIIPAVIGAVLVLVGIPEGFLKWVLIIAGLFVWLVVDELRLRIKWRIDRNVVEGPFWTYLADRYQKVIPWVREKGWLRESEESGRTTVTLYCIGLILSLYVFGLTITLWGFLMLGCGDPTARSMGQGMPVYRFESGPQKGKSVGGMIGFVLASLSALFILNMIAFHLGSPLFNPRFFLIQFCGALAGSLAELFAGKYDNLAIPLVTGLVMWSLF